MWYDFFASLVEGDPNKIQDLMALSIRQIMYHATWKLSKNLMNKNAKQN